MPGACQQAVGFGILVEFGPDDEPGIFQGQLADPTGADGFPERFLGMHEQDEMHQGIEGFDLMTEAGLDRFQAMPAILPLGLGRLGGQFVFFLFEVLLNIHFFFLGVGRKY